jgi:hypothetical protein
VMRTECDNCKALGDSPPPQGWVILTEVMPPSEESFVTLVTGSGGTSTEGVFCSYRCVAEYAATKALVESVEQGGEQP